MRDYTEDELYDMSDDELATAFKEAKVNMANEDTNTTAEESAEEDFTESDDLDNSQESDLDGAESGTGTEDKAASEDVDDVTDMDTTTPEEQTAADKVDVKQEVQPVQKYSYKANGKEFKFTEEEIKAQFPKVFAQAMDYTKKMQAIKPYRKTIDAIEQAGLSHDDVSLAIDVLKGDKAAIAALLKRTGVDTLELDTDDTSYVPKSYGRDENALALKDVVDEIRLDPEYVITERVIDREWDQTSWDEMKKNPVMIKGLHADIKSGLFHKLQPIADKLKVYNPNAGSDLDYYFAAYKEHKRELATQQQAQAVQEVQQTRQVQQVQQAQKVAQVKTQDVSRKSTEQAAAKRKAAAPTKTGPSKPQGITDYLDDSDESYYAWYKSLQNK
jgi:hypothetical protein